MCTCRPAAFIWTCFPVVSRRLITAVDTYIIYSRFPVVSRRLITAVDTYIIYSRSAFSYMLHNTSERPPFELVFLGQICLPGTVMLTGRRVVSHHKCICDNCIQEFPSNISSFRCVPMPARALLWLWTAMCSFSAKWDPFMDNRIYIHHRWIWLGGKQTRFVIWILFCQ